MYLKLIEQKRRQKGFFLRIFSSKKYETYTELISKTTFDKKQ